MTTNANKTLEGCAEKKLTICSDWDEGLQRFLFVRRTVKGVFKIDLEVVCKNTMQLDKKSRVDHIMKYTYTSLEP